MTQADFRLIVIPGQFDDLGKVLKDLAYKYETLNFDDLSNSSHLKDCRVVFVSCPASLSGSELVVANLRRFINDGGALYVSDLSYSVIDQLFPGKVQFGNVSYNSNITGEIIDPGLKEVVGHSIKLHMDYTSAAGIEKANEGVQILIEGVRVRSSEGKFPFLISFRQGDGQVIYTVFHNSKQVNETEKKLLNYLVFRPIMSGAATKAAKLVQAQMAIPGKEIFASINQGEISNRFGIIISMPLTVLFVLSWEENAALGLQVWDPSGKMVKETSNSKSPLTIEIPASQPGTWTCAVKGQTVPHQNFPYVLTIATRGGKVTKPTVAVSAAPGDAKIPVQNLPIYLLVDTSAKSRDVLTPLSTGLRSFGDRLKGRGYIRYSACISIILANDTGQVATPLVDAAHYITPTLSAQGRCALGLALKNLLTNISSTSLSAKPLVIILLASDPDDDWSSKANELLEIAAQKKANIFVIGLGNYANASSLKKLTPATPLVLPVVTQVYSQQLFEWLYSIVDVILSGLDSGGSGQHKNVPPPPACLKTL